MKRLLFATVMLVCASGLAGDSGMQATAAEQLNWQLAVHAYTFRKFTINEAITKTMGLGLKYMSLSGSVQLDSTNTVKTIELSETDQRSLREQVRKAGLKLVNLGVVQLAANEVESRKVFEFAKSMGIDTLVAEPAPEALDTVEKLCKEYNIRVAIHNHPKPSRYWNPDTVLEAIKGRSPLLGACADTGHWIRSGLDPLECLQRLEGRVHCLHFKDLAEKSPKTHDVPWGTGVADSRALLEELQRQKFQGAICVEYECHWDNSVPEIAECVKFFNATVAGLVNQSANASDGFGPTSKNSTSTHK